MEESQSKKRNCNKINNNKNKKRKIYRDCCSLNQLRRDCPNPKKKKKKGFNKSRSRSKRLEGKEEFATMISEVFMVQDEHFWWIDSGTIRHICNDTACFKSFKAVEDDVFLYMGNSSKEQAIGKGGELLEFTSGNFLTLNDLCYV